MVSTVTLSSSLSLFGLEAPLCRGGNAERSKGFCLVDVLAGFSVQYLQSPEGALSAFGPCTWPFPQSGSLGGAGLGSVPQQGVSGSQMTMHRISGP